MFSVGWLVDRSGRINRENVWFRERKQIEEDICLNSYAILIPIIAFKSHAFRSKLKIERYQECFYGVFETDRYFRVRHSEGVEKAK